MYNSQVCLPFYVLHQGDSTNFPRGRARDKLWAGLVCKEMHLATLKILQLYLAKHCTCNVVAIICITRFNTRPSKQCTCLGTAAWFLDRDIACWNMAVHSSCSNHLQFHLYYVHYRKVCIHFNHYFGTQARLIPCMHLVHAVSVAVHLCKWIPSTVTCPTRS